MSRYRHTSTKKTKVFESDFNVEALSNDLSAAAAEIGGEPTAFKAAAKKVSTVAMALSVEHSESKGASQEETVDQQVEDLDMFYQKLEQHKKHLLATKLLTPLQLVGLLTESQAQLIGEQSTTKLQDDQLMAELKHQCHDKEDVTELFQKVLEDHRGGLLKYFPLSKEAADHSSGSRFTKFLRLNRKSPDVRKGTHSPSPPPQKEALPSLVPSRKKSTGSLPRVAAKQGLDLEDMQQQAAKLPPSETRKYSSGSLPYEAEDVHSPSPPQKEALPSPVPSRKKSTGSLPHATAKQGPDLEDMQRQVAKVPPSETRKYSSGSLLYEAGESPLDSLPRGTRMEVEPLVDHTTPQAAKAAVKAPVDHSKDEDGPQPTKVGKHKEHLMKPSSILQDGPEGFEAKRIGVKLGFGSKDWLKSDDRAKYDSMEREESQHGRKPISFAHQYMDLSQHPPEEAIEWLCKRFSKQPKGREKFETLLYQLDLPENIKKKVQSFGTIERQTEEAIRHWMAREGTDNSFDALLTTLKEAGFPSEALLMRNYTAGELSAKRNRPQKSAYLEQEEKEKASFKSAFALGRRSVLKRQFELCELLDAPVRVSCPTNWDDLARELGYKPEQRKEWSYSQSPTLALLNDWKASGKFDKETLRQALVAIKREDVARLLESRIKRFLPKRSWLSKAGASHQIEKTMYDLPKRIRDRLGLLLASGRQTQNWLALSLWLDMDITFLETYSATDAVKSQKFVHHISGALSRETNVPVMSVCEALKAIGRDDCLSLLEQYLSDNERGKLEEMKFLPEILRQPKDSVIPFGSTVTVTCLACGTQPLTYRWYCSGALMKGQSWQNVCAIPGEYTCQVSNAFGKVESVVVKVAHSAPEQIVSQGETAIHAFQVALKEGSIVTYRVRVMVVGQDRTGKSSLIRSLLKKCFVVNDSTIGIEITSATFALLTPTGEEDEVDGVPPCEFTEENPSGAGFCEGEVARAVAFAIQEEQRKRQLELLESEDFGTLLDGETSEYYALSDEEGETYEQQDLPESDEESEKNSVASGSEDGVEKRCKGRSKVSDLAEPDTGSTASLPREKKVEEMEELVAKEELQLSQAMTDMVVKLLKDVKVNKDAEHVLVRFYDFAGQPVFYNTHSVFMSDSGIYLLIHNLASDLLDQAKVRFSEKGHERVIDHDGYLSTNIDYLYAWLSSVYTASGSQAPPPVSGDDDDEDDSDLFDGCEPPVIIVGTHRDSVARRGHHQLASTIVKKSRFLRKSFANKAYSRHITRPFFFVDNSLSGSDVEDPEVVLLRQRIRHLALSQRRTKQTVPVKWLKFELSIEQLVHQDKVNFLSFNETAAVAQKVCGIASLEQLTVMLAFYHGLGIIVHFGAMEQLHNLVVVNPQWLVDIFKRLITVPALDELQPELADLWKQVVETGLLHPKLVAYIWSDQEEKRRPLLLRIMAKFDLVCPFHQVSRTIATTDSRANDESESAEEDELFTIDGECYMVPSLLRSEPPNTAFFKLSPQDAPPLCLISAIGFIPEAFFYRMVARCVARYPVCPQLYRRFARLHPDEQFAFLLFHGPFWLKIVVQSSANTGEMDGEMDRELLHQHCVSLLGFVLQAASEIKQQGMSGLVFSLGTSVPEKFADTDDKERLVYVSDKKCSHHSPPLPACAEVNCRGVVTRQDCIQLPPHLPPVKVSDEEEASPLVRTPKGLLLWFSSSQLMQEKKSEPVKVDVTKEEEGYECPSIIKQPAREVKVRVGDVLTLKCEARGKPAVSYQWRCGGRNLPGQMGSVLRLPNVESPRAEMAFYNCLVKNKAGYLFSRSTTVHFLNRCCPVITKDCPPHIAVKYGADLTLTCEADGPDLQFQWYFFNRPVPNGHSPQLRIRYVCDWHDGLYYCEVRNAFGVAKTTKINVELNGEQAYPLSGSRQLQAQTISEKDFVDNEEHFATAKVALLIGNRNYRNHAQLIHPENDVVEVGRALRDVGFETSIHINLTFWEMTNAIECFLRLLDPGVYGLFYYAGHGFEDQSHDTYLVPVDVETSNNTRKCIRLEAIHYEMQQRNTRLITMVMDCCRMSLQVPEQRARCSLPLASFANFVKHFSCSTRARALERSKDNNSVYAQTFTKLLTASKMPLLDFFSQVEQGVVKTRAVDKQGTYTAQRPEMRCSLASRHLTLSDRVNQQHSIHRKVMKNWAKYHKFNILKKIELSSRWAPVSIEFFLPLTNILLITSLVEKNVRDCVRTKFMRPKHLPSGVEVYDVSTTSKAPVFLHRVVQFCCPDHNCVLAIVGVQRLQEDFTFRLSVQHDLESTFEELSHTLPRESFTCESFKLFN